MIKLYTNEKYIPHGRQLIYLNDNLFDGIAYERDFTAIDLEIMYKIDKAEMIDSKQMKIQTPYGITGIESLSTGCKTLLNIMNPDADKNHIFSLNGCSYNILDIIFDFVEENRPEQELYINTSEIAKCKDRDFEVDGQFHFESAIKLTGYIMDRG